MTLLVFDRLRVLLLLLPLSALLGCATAIDTQPGSDASSLGDSGVDGGSMCGNGVVEGTEECDDNNLLPGDGCSPACRLEECDDTTCFGGCCDAAGDCQPGLQDTVCGEHGDACSDCTGQNRFCDNHACIEFTDCTPDDTMDCGLCGLRTCDQNGEWGLCEDQGVCAPDAVQFVGSCGDCGRELRTCQSDCTWGLSSCEDEGECTPDAAETRDPCGCCGTEERTCTSACTWTNFVCVNENSCSSGLCCDCQCVDVTNNNDYCGDCNTQCVGGDLCCDSQCRDIQTDDDYCGDCVTDCGSTDQCCAASCEPYVCVAGTFRRTAGNPDWPADPDCQPDTSIGVLTEIHWNHKWKFSLCLVSAHGGSIQTCTEATGNCTPPDCPVGQTSIGIFHDKTNNADHTLQRICLAEVESGVARTCTHAIGTDDCDPPACQAGEVELAPTGFPVVSDVEPLTDTTTEYRFCVVPTCPPSCS